MTRTKTQEERGKLLLFDGSALAYRAHFAMSRSGLSSSDGLPTGATFGFASEVWRTLESQQAAYAAMVFDTAAPTFRHKRFPAYKATREKMPQELVDQLQSIQESARALGLACLSRDGFEADDIIGTLVRLGRERDLRVVIVTGDKDLMQLVDEHTHLLNLSTRGSLPKEIGPQDVQTRFGVPPDKVIDLLALMGDASDNVPGVPGIGPKGASKLIRELGSVEEVLDHISLVGSKRVREALRTNREQALLSKELVTIDTHVPLDLRWEELHFEGPHAKEARELFRRLGFRSLAQEMARRGAPSEEPAHDYRIVRTSRELKELIGKLSSFDLWSVDTETTGLNPLKALVVGLSFSGLEGQAFYVPLNLEHPLAKDAPKALRGQATLDLLRPVLEDPRRNKCGQNVKYDLLVLRKYGVELKGILSDTMVASYLIEPEERERNLDALSLRHFGYTKIKTEELIGKGKQQTTMDRLPVDQVGIYACEDADFTYRLARRFMPRLETLELRPLHDQVETPLILVLSDMEETGVRVDRELLKTMAKELEQETQQVKQEIFKLAGTSDLNIQSPKQLGVLLFETLKVQELSGYKPKRTKTGWATGQEVLEALAEHPLPAKILEYRSLAKLLNTYILPLPDFVDPDDGRIHASFNQTVAATGRISSSHPNMQNIPVRSKLGRRIRQAFLASSSQHRLLAADYSQIELRIMAHLSEDENMLRAFQEGADIHRDTAARVFGVAPSEVDPSLRSRAKAINFGILYGMGPNRLARETGLSREEAKEFITRYFDAFPRIRGFIEELKETVRKEGRARTLLGRRRRIPDILSSNGMLRAAAENMAVNTPIQGSAADILKLAMVRIHAVLREKNLKTRMILTVHDELVFDVPLPELELVRKLVVKEMEEAHPLKVPLKVDAGCGNNWLEAH